MRNRSPQGAAKMAAKDKKPAPEAAQAPQPTQTPTPELNQQEQKEVRIIERVIENREIAPQDAFGKLTRPQIELIKRTVAKGASDDELRLFIQVCKGANLNPFLKQVFLVPRWDSSAGREVRAIQVSIDGFRAIAESSGAYAGNEDPVFDGEQEVEYGAGEKKTKIMVPKKATVTVHKIVEGSRYAFTATARWEEYYPGPKMGFQWHIRPYLMLGKCAEALALRKAFPKLLSGMYAQEEMDKGQSEAQEQERAAAALNTVKTAINNSTLEQLQDFRKKVEKSTKYAADQKADLLATIDARVKELTPPAPTEAKQ